MRYLGPMDERVRLITRDEIAFGLRESKKPGKEVIYGAIGGFIQQAIDAATHSQSFDWRAGFSAAAIGAALLWLSRFLVNVWRAPRVIAAEDRKALENAYERLQGRLANERSQLEIREIVANTKLQSLVFLQSWAASLVQDGDGWRLLSKQGALDEWLAQVEQFKQSLVDLTAAHLSHGERIEVLSAFEIFPTTTSHYHVDMQHAEVWERMRALSKALGELVKRHERLVAAPKTRHLDAKPED
jgi:hypothetical protein